MLTNCFYLKNTTQVSEHKNIIVFGDLQISLKCLVSEDVIRWMPPVASFTKEVNPRLAKRPLKSNGRLIAG